MFPYASKWLGATVIYISPIPHSIAWIMINTKNIGIDKCVAMETIQYNPSDALYTKT